MQITVEQQITVEHRTLFNEIVSNIDRKQYKYFIQDGEVRLQYIYYCVDSDLIMYYSPKTKLMRLYNYKFWQKFSLKFCLNYNQTCEITSVLVEEYTKINGVKTF